MEVCTNPDILKVIKFLLLLLDIIKIIIPISLIIIGTIDMAKAVISNEEKEQKKITKLFIKRILYAIAVFAIPWFIEVFMITLGDLLGKKNTTNFTDCIENVNNLEYYEKLAKEKQEQEEKKKREELELQILNAKENQIIKNNVITNNSNEGTFIGQKYNLTEKQLRGIAKLCQKEQGSAIGAAAEASLIANRFEFYGSKFGTGADGLYNYVRNSGWWAGGKKHTDNTEGLKDSIYTAVYNVLVLGNRTLPFYVDEHDCIDCGKYGFDIIKISINNYDITNKSELLNKNNYIQDKTTIYNKYDGIYTFYEFPTPKSDPFGYTKRAKNKYDSLNKK